MRKRMYSDDGWRYTEDGRGLMREVETQVGPIMDKYAEMGFDLNDIKALVNDGIQSVSATFLLTKSIAAHKAKRDAKNKNEEAQLNGEKS